MAQQREVHLNVMPVAVRPQLQPMLRKSITHVILHSLLSRQDLNGSEGELREAMLDEKRVYRLNVNAVNQIDAKRRNFIVKGDASSSG